MHEIGQANPQRLTKENPSAGEHTCIVVKPLRSAEVEGTAWLGPFVADFRVRLMALLPSAFKCAS